MRLLRIARLAQQQARTTGRGVWLYRTPQGWLHATLDAAPRHSTLLALVWSEGLVRYVPRRAEMH